MSLRHECVHGILPSLESLKCATDFGLQWLRNNYWEPQILLNQQIRESSGTVVSLYISTVPTQFCVFTAVYFLSLDK